MTGTESVRTESRRTLHLTFEEPDRTPPPAPPLPAPRPAMTDQPKPRRSAQERVLVVAERMFGDWAPTLHLALLLVALVLAGLVVIALVVGAVPALISAALLTALVSLRKR
ncbi:hypothetical protein [Actinokineospora enzanensis]|uniref:hypothetical protein n=1 Tax=Actinokineospora enzanensis TaxID=155975 RepID=UPI00036B429D|nr:hypothetical protein [Actinokineospora enzanensis]